MVIPCTTNLVTIAPTSISQGSHKQTTISRDTIFQLLGSIDAVIELVVSQTKIRYFSGVRQEPQHLFLFKNQLFLNIIY